MIQSLLELGSSNLKPGWCNSIACEARVLGRTENSRTNQVSGGKGCWNDSDVVPGLVATPEHNPCTTTHYSFHRGAPLVTWRHRETFSPRKLHFYHENRLTLLLCYVRYVRFPTATRHPLTSVHHLHFVKAQGPGNPCLIPEASHALRRPLNLVESHCSLIFKLREIPHGLRGFHLKFLSRRRYPRMIIFSNCTLLSSYFIPFINVLLRATRSYNLCYSTREQEPDQFAEK